MTTLSPQARCFADACHTNALDELVSALAGPADATDCATWRITPTEWREAIETAIRERQS